MDVTQLRQQFLAQWRDAWPDLPDPVERYVVAESLMHVTIDVAWPDLYVAVILGTCSDWTKTDNSVEVANALVMRHWTAFLGTPWNVQPKLLTQKVGQVVQRKFDITKGSI